MPALAQSPEAAPTAPDDSPRALALRAAGSALPFAAALARQIAGIASGLRRGDDTIALTALGDATDNLQSFLSFLILIDDLMVPASDRLADYRKRLTAAIESAGPALALNDFVEVADSLGEDLLPLIEEYAELDAVIVDALGPPPP